MYALPPSAVASKAPLEDHRSAVLGDFAPLPLGEFRHSIAQPPPHPESTLGNSPIGRITPVDRSRWNMPPVPLMNARWRPSGVILTIFAGCCGGCTGRGAAAAAVLPNTILPFRRLATRLLPSREILASSNSSVGAMTGFADTGLGSIQMLIWS